MPLNLGYDAIYNKIRSFFVSFNIEKLLKFVSLLFMYTVIAFLIDGRIGFKQSEESN